MQTNTVNVYQGGNNQWNTPMTGTTVRSEELRGDLRRDEPMSRHTSWRTGGAAENFYIPADLDDLCAYMSGIDPDDNIIWIGLGSNLLVRDGGIKGHVIAVTGVLDEIQDNGAMQVNAGAGVTCAKLARFCAAAGYTGIEFFAGIPGTVGGALSMNAGAFGGETWDYVTSVITIDRTGKTRTRPREEFDIGYRRVVMPSTEWFVEATFSLRPDTQGNAKQKIKSLLSQRAAAQPTGESSCGSVFRNPVADHAGRLIDESGLKGLTIGAARVSEKHANFIINEGHATAADIEELIQKIRKIVEDNSGILLQPEVRIVGERPEGLHS